LEKDMTESQLKGIKTVQRSGEHLLHMIEEILDIAKIEAQKVDLQPIDFRLSDLLEDIFEMIRIKAEQKELTISKDFAPDIPIAIFADDKRMRQILLNFLNNAVKFTKHGQIIFRVLSDNKIDPKISKLRFEVEDTGVGIPEDKVDKIFEPFYQLGELKDRAEGTGLGLAISKSIVQIMGGELYISSTPDKGTLIGFKADFPISTVALSSRESILERRIIGIKGKPPKCLIADDNADNLQILMDVLKPIGFKIEIALNGNEAVKKASMFLPNIIFMDILMPEMDGYQAANAIRKLKKLKDVIIIAVSASVGILSEHKKVELGFDGFLLKPIQLELIFDLLQEKLKLDWIIEQPKTIQEINDIENIIFPSDPLLKELILAAKHHDLTALDEWLEKTVQIETIYIPFVAKVKTLISKYQFKQIISLCETANK